ncbi:MAG: FkbM family methyltransferase [Sphingomicrobium sp.]
MSVLFRIANAAGRIGLTPWVARVASLAYRGSDFSVDDHGRWVNRQAEATFVSPVFHTKSYAAVNEWVLDHWTWGYLPRAGDTVIDVGAGIGEEAVIFSRLVGESGRVISIEAHPRTFSCLQETIRHSGLTNVTPLYCAVAEQDGELSISDVDVHLANSVIGEGANLKVPARSLDSIAEEFGLGEIALLRMNIEGAEKLAVKGASRIASRVHNMVISCHDFVATEYGGLADFRTKGHVRSMLESQGFTISTRPDAAEPWVRDYLYGRKGK